MPLAHGSRLGPYEIDSSIGRGGMGEVFKARDTRLNRDVAIKVSTERFTERFEREARAIAALNHPNICTLFDVGSSADLPGYLVMEFVEGESPKGPLPLEQVLDCARQMIGALDSAHERGITHRDLKPANLKITPDGVLKILDFGLAKVGGTPRADVSNENSPTMTLGMTEAGMILGTAAYMAPEQAKGKPVDRRADIWAFGVVLYELSTGKRLFKGEDVTDTLASVLKEQPDFDAVPDRLRPLLKRCLQKDPKQRLRDIGDALPLLDAAPTIAPATLPAGRKSWLPWTAAAVCAIAAAAFAALWLQPKPLPEVTRFQIFAPKGFGVPLNTPAISPDGRTLVYAIADEKGRSKLVLRRLDQTEVRDLPDTDGAQHPFFSPDGRSIAFAAINILKRIDLDGGSPQHLADVTGPWHGDWGVNGDILASASSIIRLPAKGGAPTNLQPSGNGHPSFFPDGRRYAYRGPLNNSMSILMSSLDSKDSSLLLEAADSAPILAPTPNGKLYLLYAKGSDRQTDLMAQQLDPASAALIGEPVTLVPSIGMVANPVVRPTVGVSASGLLAYQSGHGASDGTLTWLDRAGKPLGTAGKPGSFNRPALSPDGIQLATIQNSDLSVTDLTRGTTTRLTFDRSALGPVWSPDGKQVAVNRNGKGVVVNLDGSGERALPEKNGGVVGWFPGGFIHTDGNILTLFAGDAPGVQIGLPSSARPVVSPDGKYVAYDSIASGRRQVYVEPLPPGSGRVQISVEGGTAPRWRRDGKELFFITPGKMMAVDVTLQPKVSAAIPHPLFDLPPGGWNGDVHPSGQRFIHLMRSGEAELDNPITVVQNWWVDLEKK